MYNCDVADVEHNIEMTQVLRVKHVTSLQLINLFLKLFHIK